jgi:hypothetical protein
VLGVLVAGPASIDALWPWLIVPVVVVVVVASECSLDFLQHRRLLTGALPHNYY